MFLRAFATLFVTFWRGRSGVDEAPGFGGRDDFSDIFLHSMCPPEDYFYCALFGVNCMQSFDVLFSEISVLFCWV